MQREDPSATEELVKCLVDLMDRNKDGTVSKKEFLYQYPVNRKRFMVSQTDHQCVGTVLGIGIVRNQARKSRNLLEI